MQPKRAVMRLPLLFLVLTGCVVSRDVPLCADRLTPSDAIDCGSADIGEDLTPIIECLGTAMQSGQPAIGTWWTHGIDSVQHLALIFDGEELWRLYQDRYGPRAGWNIEGRQCLDPTYLPDQTPPVIECGAWEPERGSVPICDDL